MATQMDDQATVTEATVESAAIETEARATVMVELKVAMADRAHMEALTTPDLPSQQQLLTRTPKLPTTTLSMPSGPLTMLRTRLKILTLRTVAGRRSWLNTPNPKQDTVRTMVKLMVRHSLLRLVLELLRHHHLQIPLVMERHRHRRLLPVHLQAATVRYVRPFLLIYLSLTRSRFLLHPVCKSVKRL